MGYWNSRLGALVAVALAIAGCSDSGDANSAYTTPAPDAAGESTAGSAGAQSASASGTSSAGTGGMSTAGSAGAQSAGASGTSSAGTGGMSTADSAGAQSAGASGTSSAGTGGASSQDAGGSGPSADPNDSPDPSQGCGLDERAQSGVVQLMNRTYIFHVPAGIDASVPLPLVLNFHGYTSTAAAEQRMTAMDVTADEQRFMVAYPEGLGNSFNAGDICCGTSQGTVDDVAFARDIVADVGERACLDRRRVYSTGMSNGGMMSFRLACEASDLVAAIGPVVAMTGVSPCEPPRGVPVISFNGIADPLATYAMANPVNEEWAVRNQCTVGPITETHAASSCKVWSNCRDGAEVRVCSLEGMGHCWPGAPSGCLFGSGNDDIDANTEMWKFFSRFRLPR